MVVGSLNAKNIWRGIGGGESTSARAREVGEGQFVLLERTQKVIRRHEFKGGRGTVRVG